MVRIEMELPKSCYECPFNKGEYSPNEIEKRYCCLTRKFFSKKDYKKRPVECPIKEDLKEQEGITPVPPEDEFGLYRCGKCYHQLFRCVDKYCSRCGTVVKWD